MNCSFIPQKVTERRPIYADKQVCNVCKSTDNFPVMNMYGSPRRCNKCSNLFSAQIVGYRNIVVEKDVN